MRILVRKDLYLPKIGLISEWTDKRPKTNADRSRIRAGCIYKFDYYFGDGLNFRVDSIDKVIFEGENIEEDCDKPEFLAIELNELIRKRLIDII